MKVKNKEGEVVVVKFAPKECPPGDEAFGKWAWSCNSLARAREKLREVIESGRK